MKSTKIVIKVPNRKSNLILELLKDKNFVKDFIQKQKDLFPEIYKNIDMVCIEVHVVD